MLVLSLKNGDNDPTRNSLDEYCVPLVEIKDFNALIDKKLSFDQPVRIKQEAYEKLAEISGHDYYTTVNVLDYLYYQKYYKLIGTFLSRQKKMQLFLNKLILQEN